MSNRPDSDVPLPTRLTREYGLRHPFVGAGMGFIAHEQLAAAVTNAGGLGRAGSISRSCGQPRRNGETIARLDFWAVRGGPHLRRYRDSGQPVQTSISTCACSWAYRWSFFTMTHHRAAGSARYVPQGIRVWMQASSPELAAAAIELGVNGIVAQGSEAGGHARGRIPLHALLATIRHKWPDMLVLGAGGISDGTAAAAALSCGR